MGENRRSYSLPARPGGHGRGVMHRGIVGRLSPATFSVSQSNSTSFHWAGESNDARRHLNFADRNVVFSARKLARSNERNSASSRRPITRTIVFDGIREPLRDAAIVSSRTGYFLGLSAPERPSRPCSFTSDTNRRACTHTWPDGLASNGVTTAEPAQFREAVAAMNATTVRPEIELGPIRPPQRLAPFSYALGAEVRHPDTAIVPERSEGDAFGRLILLHDPEGAEAWDGTMRLVAYIQADLDSSEAVDPLLPEVAWSWLVEALESRAEHVTALGGTVTATTSVRYGDISGPPRAHQLELRASWTATTLELGPHVQAFCEVLEHAAGLPPDGVTDLSSRSRA
jgi:Protein of unknown function (DUF3000)